MSALRLPLLLSSWPGREALRCLLDLELAGGAVLAGANGALHCSGLNDTRYTAQHPAHQSQSAVALDRDRHKLLSCAWLPAQVPRHAAVRGRAAVGAPQGRRW